MYRSCQGLQFSSWRLLPLATPFVWMITAVRNVTASGVLTKIKQKFTNRNFNSNGETNRIGNGDRSGKKIYIKGVCAMCRFYRVKCFELSDIRKLEENEETSTKMRGDFG